MPIELFILTEKNTLSNALKKKDFVKFVDSGFVKT